MFPEPIDQVTHLLTERALQAYPGQIDLVAYYGSYAQGTANENSDLDIFYVPAEGKDPPAGRTFLLQGRLFDFWAIRWETLEGFATGRARGWSFAPAIVQAAKVLYARSDEQVQRLEALKQKVVGLQSPASRPHMVQRALEAFPFALAALGNLRLAAAGGDLCDLRHAGWKLILTCWECLALGNQTFCERGWGHLLQDLPRLRQRPAGLEQLITTLSQAVEPEAMLEAAEKLALGTRQVLRDMQGTLAVERQPGEVFDSAYPEIKDGLRKVLSACQRGEALSASVAAWFIQTELSQLLHDLHSRGGSAGFNLYGELAGPYRDLGFPSLMQAGDLPELAAQTQLLDEKLRQWLRAQSVDLCVFDTLEELENSL